jgi:cytochrome c oxidase subunit II
VLTRLSGVSLSTRTSPAATPPEHPTASRGLWARRVGVPIVLLLGVLLMSGCNVLTFGGFRGVTVQGKEEFKLWQGMLIAGFIVGGIVYALIIWSSIMYRRHHPDYFPRQFHSNKPIEVIYTTLPILIIAGIFYFTVVTENEVDAVSSTPNEIVNVLAYRWGWQFAYDAGNGRSQGVLIKTAAEPKLLAQPFASNEYPQLVLPKGETVRIVLTSADTIHGFYIPEFNFSRYAQPAPNGAANVFDFTPTTDGVYSGQCSQFCGLYHSEMRFSVKVESPAQFQQWLSTTQASQAQGAA